MMDENHELDRQSVATVTEEQALEWLLRRDRGVWAERDQSELDAWLAESWAHRVAYWRLDAAWGRADRLGAMRPHASGPEPATAKEFRRMIFGATAGLVAVVIFGVAATYRSSPAEHIYATNIGEHKTVALDDGSHIELNTDTAISVTLSSSQRNVRIDKGEAYFEVTHDATHPFTVMAGSGRILDLGTKFLIRRDANRLQVTLLEGHAQFSVDNKDARTGSASLAAGDVAVATLTSFSVTRKSLPILHAELGWRRGLLIFDNTPLTDAAAEFNRYNRTKLVLADRATESVTVGGTFSARDVAAFARVVKGVLGLRVENRGSAILVSR
jgi:transmembrane sensor